MERVETDLFQHLVTVIMYLNKNGVPLEEVRYMIEMKLDHAFDMYDNIRDAYNDTIRKFRGL